MRELREFYKLDYPNVEMSHLGEKFKLGIKDPEWIAMLQNDTWIVVSTDKGKSDGGNRSKKLPLICQDLRITHVIMSSNIDKAGRVGSS